MLESSIMLKSEFKEKDCLVDLCKTLRLIFDKARELSLDVRLAGSLGRRLALGEEITSIRNKDGLLTDIDLVIIGPNSNDIIEKFINEIQRDSPFRIDELLRTRNRIIYRPDTGYAIGINNSYQRVKRGVLEPFICFLQGIEVKTFYPATLFHMSAFIGHLRPKDFRNLREFLRKIREKGISYNEADYEPFHNLYKIRYTEHPIRERILGAIVWYEGLLPMPLRRRVDALCRPLKVLRNLNIGGNELNPS